MQNSPLSHPAHGVLVGFANLAGCACSDVAPIASVALASRIDLNFAVMISSVPPLSLDPAHTGDEHRPCPGGGRSPAARCTDRPVAGGEPRARHANRIVVLMSRCIPRAVTV